MKRIFFISLSTLLFYACGNSNGSSIDKSKNGTLDSSNKKTEESKEAIVKENWSYFVDSSDKMDNLKFYFARSIKQIFFAFTRQNLY